MSQGGTIGTTAIPTAIFFILRVRYIGYNLRGDGYLSQEFLCDLTGDVLACLPHAFEVNAVAKDHDKNQSEAKNAGHDCQVDYDSSNHGGIIVEPFCCLNHPLVTLPCFSEPGCIMGNSPIFGRFFSIYGESK